MDASNIDAAAIDELQRGFTGNVFRPDRPGYDENRSIFNAMINRRPEIIAQCGTTRDVIAAVNFARNHNLLTAVRGGGHGVAGTAVCDGGIVIDLRMMHEVAVDPARRIARADGGATWGDFDRATQAHALGTTGGRVSGTGVGGLTLGGGSGWLERKFGLACDNLRSVDLVTADGSLVTASATENPDLFWALHGGGGNFGVAVSLEFSLHDVGPEIFIGLLLHPPERGPQLARLYRDFIRTAPDEVGGGFAYLTAPPEEFVPEHVRGTIRSGLILTYAGDLEVAQRIFAPLIEFGPPDVALVMPAPYAEFQHMLDDPPGFRNYWTAEYLDDLPDEAIDVFCAYGAKMKPSPTQLILLPWGGAVARVGADETPMTKRDAAWVMHPLALWESAEDDGFWIPWARAAAADLKRFTSGGVYLNFIGEEGEDRVVAAYGKDKYERLSEIKARFDPTNMFRLNQNIKPRRAPTGVG